MQALPAEWEQHLEEGWLEQAMAELEQPPQTVTRPTPAEMALDDVDVKRLIMLVVIRLADMRRHRALSISAQSKDLPSHQRSRVRRTSLVSC